MKHKYAGLSLQEKYELLTRDFLDRDGDRFVRIRQNDRLGWEDTLPEDSAYSEAILHPASVKDLYMNAVRLARQMITSMNTPYRVEVKVDPTRSCTDSKSVYVATKVFDDPGLELGRKLDTFLGLTVHEGSHLLYTDFSESPKCRNMVIHNLQNIFEDERIERELGEHKPGLANFLKAAKYYYFGLYRKKTGDDLDDASRLFNAILSIVRYPTCLSPDDAMRFADELLEVRDIITPYPDSTADCRQRAEQVYEILKRFMEEDKARRQQSQKSQQNSQSEDTGEPDDQDISDDTGNEGNPSGSDSKNNGKDNKTKKEKSDEDGDSKKESKGNRDDNHEDSGQEQSGNDKDNDEEKDDTKESNGKETSCDNADDNNEDDADENDTEGKPGNSEADNGSEEDEGNDCGNSGQEEDGDPESVTMDDSEIAEILKELIDALKEELSDDPRDPESRKNPLEHKDVASDLLKNNALLAKECEGEVETGHNGNCILVKQEPDRIRYENSLQRVKRYIPVVSRALRAKETEYKYSITGMRSGILDTNKLCEARQGVQNVYIHKGEVKCERINVVLVIDESGSMSGIREKLARDTAVLLNEAIGPLHNVTLSIYGYSTGNNGAEIYPYREPGSIIDKNCIGSITSRWCTPTTQAVSEAAWRIRRHSKEKTLMFVISDGGADTGPGPVRNVVDKIQKDGFRVIGISISSDLTKETLEKMYDDYIVMNTLDNLASELGKTVKKAILSNTKKTA